MRDLLQLQLHSWARHYHGTPHILHVQRRKACSAVQLVHAVRVYIHIYALRTDSPRLGC
jgi:hypothetical protein